MAAISICGCYANPYHSESQTVSVSIARQRVHRFRCCSNFKPHPSINSEKGATPLLKIAVSAVTELLRFFSSSGKDRLSTVNNELRNEASVSSIDDVVMILESDYKNAYFVTGVFTCSIYSEDCLFEDPTIQFRGTELYSRNLKLLVPFFDCPSISLQKIEEGVSSEGNFVLASWKLRTHLRLPWRPLISIHGSTVYDLDDKFKIIRHSESWDVSAIEAIAQIFTPSS
ncbi:uncharacterized protein LOC127801160 isoform X2 [Diospyros lotus]|uniref:uncharacterized protein LOC127801160 isoform X2 n=1 Tax=Diospyros lotus TaxID=55363 RepID=UPI00224D0A30|nr:uncharacterized protein LOC127801160 isoform X2 [Diospyros lotus]